MDYLGKEIPKLGFGLMRLPMQGEQVDLEQTKEMVDKFMEAGFAYFDTAYGYLGGKSEVAVKAALVDRYPRESYQLATKLPAWSGAATAEEAKAMLETSLQRTGAGYFDFYLLHNCGDDRTHAFDRFGMWDFVAEQKAKGVLKHIGFSFHDTAEKLDELLTLHPHMEFVQLQINYADWESPSVQARKCYEVAMKHHKPVIIMEPVKGGLLADPPTQVAQLLQAANPQASFSSWAVRYAASLDHLITVLSGMSNLEQMEDNLATMKEFVPLNPGEQAVVEQAREILDGIDSIPCTRCQYCVKGCPQNILIPGVFGAMNKYLVYGNQSSARGSYNFATRVGGKASQCISCGQCEAVCPQHIQIIEQLEKAAQLLE